MSTHNIQANGLMDVNAFRLRVLETRSASISPESAAIADFGLLRNGCPVGPVSTGNPHELSLENAVPINGYYFSTSNASAERDPVRWTAEARVQNGSDWTRVGASVWITSFFGLGTKSVGPRLFPLIAYSTPTARGVRVNLDMRPSWPQMLIGLTWGYEWSLCFLASALAGVLRREKLVYPLYVTAMLIDVVLLASAAVGFLVQNNILEAIGTFLYLPSQVCRTHDLSSCDSGY
jgi:hypothetical protein